MTTLWRWLLVVAIVSLAAACQESAARTPQARSPETWRSVIRGTPVEQIADADSARARRMIDSLGPLAATDKVAAAGLAAALTHHPSAAIGNTAAYYLAHAGPAGLNVLLAALASPNQAAQWRASRGVGEVGLEAGSAAKRLAWLMRSENDSVASMASWALAAVAPKFKDKSVDLLRNLRFSQGYTQYNAVYQVGWSGPSASFAYPFLIRMLADTSDATRQVATEALQRAGPYARAALEKARLSGNERVRLQATMILNGLGTE